MSVNVITRRNGTSRKTYDLVELTHRLPRLDGTDSDLVARWNVGLGHHVQVRMSVSSRNGLKRDGNIIRVSEPEHLRNRLPRVSSHIDLVK